MCIYCTLLPVDISQVMGWQTGQLAGKGEKMQAEKQPSQYEQDIGARPRAIKIAERVMDERRKKAVAAPAPETTREEFLAEMFLREVGLLK